MPKKHEKRPPMRNITINIPNLYDKNIQKLIDMRLTASRSEAIRTALREYLQNEFENLKLLGYFEKTETPVKKPLTGSKAKI